VRRRNHSEEQMSDRWGFGGSKQMNENPETRAVNRWVGSVSVMLICIDNTSADKSMSTV
jgi:hypothetical protein